MNRLQRESFLNPLSKYYGEVKPEELVFDVNLQEFAAVVTAVTGLHIGGKISGSQAYDRIKVKFEELQASKEALL